jgi:hypothetical protein
LLCVSAERFGCGFLEEIVVMAANTLEKKNKQKIHARLVHHCKNILLLLEGSLLPTTVAVKLEEA